MYGQEMESFGLYEDLSLFNGDLLLEDVNVQLSAVQQQGLKDEPTIHEAVAAPKASPQVILAHPQNGSRELGLQDLLKGSPTQDLPDPFTASSAWFDTKTDLLDLLTGVETQPVPVPQPTPSPPPRVPSPTMTSQVLLPQQDANLQSIEAIQTMLLADLSEEVTAPVVSQVDSSNFMVYNPESPPQPEYVDMDILDELNQACLEEVLAYAPDPNTASLMDDPVLSPVSAADVESILSSSPPSPSQDTTLSELFSSFTSTSGSDVIDNQEIVEVLSTSVGPQRPVREKARSTPYSVTATTSCTSSHGRAKGDRKQRKKEQNRTAALRYREKKRGEQDHVQKEADELEAKNKVLRDKVDSLSREIKYLKDLMAEVHEARSKNKKSGGAS